MCNQPWPGGGPVDEPGQEPWHIELCGLCRRIVDRDSEAVFTDADGVVLHQCCADELRAEGVALLNPAHPTFEARGDGRYRVFGPGFIAEVHMFQIGDRWACGVDSCNNPAINAWDIQIWCEVNIR